RSLAFVLSTSLTGCAFALGPKPPADWAPEVRAQVPPSAVAIDGGTFLGAWVANGVIIHSSREHGTFVLTNDHVARAVAESGGAVVHVFDAATGTERTLPATNFAPSAAELLAPEKDDLSSLLGETMRKLGGDVAVLRVETDELLPASTLGA